MLIVYQENASCVFHRKDMEKASQLFAQQIYSTLAPKAEAVFPTKAHHPFHPHKCRPNLSPISEVTYEEPLELAPCVTIPFEATPLEATPLEATPLEATPLEATSLEATPLEATSLGATPLEASPPGASPFKASSQKSFSFIHLKW
jgi:hypothetical protein